MKTAVLLINLGTPDSPSVKNVRGYLREFLMDPKVIELPTPLRWILVNLIIAPFRGPKSAAAYQKIWTEEGSPLYIHSKNCADNLQARLGKDFHVRLGMRYGKPSIQSAIEKLNHAGYEKLIILPLFPQHSEAASGSAIEKAMSYLPAQNKVHVIKEFYNHPEYIASLAEVYKENIDNFNPENILMSYHGLPEKFQDYREQCFATSRALGKVLNLKPKEYTTCFQSRLGKLQWIKPYTDEILPELAAKGIKRIAVLCPAFTADCLETLEEIGIRAKEQWESLGGESLKLIPCVNSHVRWITGLENIIKSKTA